MDLATCNSDLRRAAEGTAGTHCGSVVVQAPDLLALLLAAGSWELPTPNSKTGCLVGLVFDRGQELDFPVPRLFRKELRPTCQRQASLEFGAEGTLLGAQSSGRAGGLPPVVSGFPDRASDGLMA